MTTISRRNFLKFAGAAGGAALVSAPEFARAATPGGEESALLIDTTLCVGCRGCEAACAETNGLPGPERCGDRGVFDQKRDTSTTAYTVVKRIDNPKDPSTPRYAKKQCMHCVEPACVSACLARALDKTPQGPVIYHPERCLGCRYCMLACPFEIPRFEYEKAAPYIKKCHLCSERQAQGKGPACAEVCPSGALQAGKRGELIDLAKRRIYQNPDRYVRHVYGETEVGGTNVLYLADVDFAQIGLPDNVGTHGYPELTKGALGAMPFVMTLWPPLLMGLYSFAKGREQKAHENQDRQAVEDRKHE